MKKSILLFFVGLLIVSGVGFMHAQATSTKGSAVNQAQKSRLGKYSITRYHRSHPLAQWSRTTTATSGTMAPTISPSVVVPQYSLQGAATLTPYSPLLTAVDPYSNAPNSADGLKPGRPFWYAVDNAGLTILRIGDNSVVHRVPWPATISVVQPDGEYLDLPAPEWEPVAMTVTYPTEEALASNSETPPTMVYVVMAHSGYEWQSNPNPPTGQDPHLRDMLVPSTNPATESSMLVSVDVSDPTFDPAENAAGPIIAAAILGHGAGQLAYDPGTDLIYVGNMPSPSLPANLQSFVSVIPALAPPVAEPAGAGPPAPEAPMVVMCGPEHVDEGLLAGDPYVWPCEESGDGPATWEFSSLPPWMKAHVDTITGKADGLLYGTPTENGTWTYQARVIDYGDTEAGPLTSEWMTFSVNVIPTGVASEVEAGFEAGIPGGQGIAGTGSCTPAPTSTPGSVVPAWIDVQPQTINNVVTGCYVMGTAPISGEYYEFALPDFQFAYPFDREPVIFSGNVVGPYMFDPLPAGVSISGLAWHQVEKLHDPSTEADILNSEFIGVDRFTGQLYRILPPQGSIEVGTVVAPPEISVEPDTITLEGQSLLEPLKTFRPDIAGQLGVDRTVVFGDLAIEADRDIYVTARWILDPLNSTVISIGGPAGSTIADGAMLKVSSATVSTIDVPEVQAYSVALDSNLAPAIPGVEKGQIDHGVLWAAGTNTGNLAVIDTAVGQVVQPLSITGASSIGGLSVDTGLGSAYVANPQNVSIFGVPGGLAERSPVIWNGAAATFSVGTANSFKVVTTGYPKPRISYAGTLPNGVTLTDNQDGTATLAGTPPAGIDGDYSFTITASNGVVPEATQAFILTIAGPPVFTSPNATAFSVGSPGSFMITTTGAPSVTVLWCGGVADPLAACPLPSWLTWTDNEDGTATLGGTPAVGSEGNYTFAFWASTGVAPDAVQLFTLTVNAGSGGGTNTAPAITSPIATTFTVGQPGSFQFTTTGTPTPTLTSVGALPNGVIFVNNGNGTGALAGVPAAGTQGSYPLAITASNTVGSVNQTFTLTVNPAPQVAPTITSANSATFTFGSFGSFTVTATGTPTPTLAYTGTLPGGVSFNVVGNGIATLAGTPTAAGTYTLNITASNGAQPNASQTFTLTVRGTAPAITSVGTATFTVGTAGSFTVISTGTPTARLSAASLPAWLTFTDHGNGTATLAGTPTGLGNVSLTITADNGIQPNATQRFVLNVQGVAPAITSAGTTTFTVGLAGSFTVTATGAPTPKLSISGSLPGGVAFIDNGNSTGVLAGTPANGTAGSYTFTIIAANGAGSDAMRTFTLTIIQPLTVVTTSLPGATAGQQYSYQLQAAGGVAPYNWTLTARRSLPSSINLSSAGVLSGRTNQAGTYTFTVRVNDSASHSATGSLTLTIAPRR